jgi:hypothetical protein
MSLPFCILKIGIKDGDGVRSGGGEKPNTTYISYERSLTVRKFNSNPNMNSIYLS